MFQLQTSLGANLPISLVLLTDGVHGQVAFIKTSQFKTIFDQPTSLEGTPEAVAAVFDEEGFKIGEEEFHYNTSIDYKHNETLLKWLQQQNLQLPKHISF